MAAEGGDQLSLGIPSLEVPHPPVYGPARTHARTLSGLSRLKTEHVKLGRKK